MNGIDWAGAATRSVCAEQSAQAEQTMTKPWISEGVRMKNGITTLLSVLTKTGHGLCDETAS